MDKPLSPGASPCVISWCVALTDELFCACHKKDQGLHPQTYKHHPRPKHYPPTPWDDERPWYEPRSAS
jgi:hypothetical protein